MADREKPNTIPSELSGLKSDVQKGLHGNPLDRNVGALIISSEILKPASLTTEKVDELSSLEREIAELDQHHVEPMAPGVAKRVNSQIEGHGGRGNEGDRSEDKILFEMQPRKASNMAKENVTNRMKANSASMEGVLGHEDLIAVLKGIDQEVPDDAIEQLDVKTGVIEGVTIEGEGEFQVIDVFDDESDDAISKEVDNKPIIKENNTTKYNVNNLKPYGSVTGKMTREEERAMAMEQIEGLRSHQERRRRKQDIKPLNADVHDLATSLGADWSDDDTLNDHSCNLTSGAGSSKTTACSFTKSNQSPVAVEQRAQVDILAVSTDRNDLNTSEKIKNFIIQNSKANVSNSESGFSETNKTVSSLKSMSNVENEKLSLNAPQQNITGFKRTRIIKRKIIWDPDAPETQFSYAQLVRNTSKTKAESAEMKNACETVVQNALTSNKSTKREMSAKKVRPLTPKSSISVKGDMYEKKLPRSVSSPQSAGKLSPDAISTTLLASEKHSKASTNTDNFKGPIAAKRRSQTPVANCSGSMGLGGIGGVGVKKKKISEIDRLMGDEGAVNMLNSLENERNKLKTEGERGDKPHKPLMRSRASTISERIIKRDIQSTSVTKKDTVTSNMSTVNITTDISPTVIKNKRANKPKPSSTWDYVYKQQANEDSMIIRRRSNSSYSSTASLHRSSLDGPTPPKAPKTFLHAPSEVTTSTTTSTTVSSTTSSKMANKSTTRNSKSPIATSSMNGSRSNINVTGSRAFEFAKPENKSQQKAAVRRTKSPNSLISTNSSIVGEMKKITSGGNRRTVRSPAGVEDAAITHASNSDVIVKKVAKIAQIIFNTHKSRLSFTFTVQMLYKLMDILEKLASDNDCHVVVMMTNAPNFCQGIDCTDLATGAVEKRKHAALQMGNAVRNYLKTLLTFPKPLVAAVNGHNVGLGVTQLALFDIVIASDKASYETIYAKIGQLPEGFCIWNKLSKINNNFKIKLFWLCEKLNTPDFSLSGLVHKMNASNKVNDEAILTAKRLALMSQECICKMKEFFVKDNSNPLLKELDDEFEIIVEQWTSLDCAENFRKYMEIGNTLTQ